MYKIGKGTRRRHNDGSYSGTAVYYKGNANHGEILR